MRMITILIGLAAVLIALIGFTGVADAPVQEEESMDTPDQDGETQDETGPARPPPGPGELDHQINDSERAG